MKSYKIIAAIILSLGFLLVAVLFAIGLFKPKPGGILVESTPASTVFIDGQMVGKTPYEGTYEPKTLVLRIESDQAGSNHMPFETSVVVTSGVKIVVRHEFAESKELSSSDIVSFEKEGGKAASLVIISDPDSSQVTVDGVAKGFTPFKLTNISVGEHQVILKSPGYNDKSLMIRTLVGYKLTIDAKLASQPKEEVQGIETEVPEIKTYIQILDTPTGFLRVRSEPGSAGREIHQAAPGEKYLFLEQDLGSGWYKIQLEAPTAGLPDGRNGWVSNEYSKKIEE